MEVYPLALYTLAFFSLNQTTQIVAQKIVDRQSYYHHLLETSPKREIISGVKAEIILNKTQT